MNFRLDHVVIAVGSLEQAVEDYRSLGFTVHMGGRHPGRTSHNALVVFEDGAYLELIAWRQPGPAERWFNVHAQHGDGLMDYALIPDDVAQAIAEAKARGLALDGPIEGGRRRPDGQELKWRTGRQATFDLPFLCGDITPREWRVPGGEVRKHANGALGLAAVAVAVLDLELSLARYCALLGIEPGDGGAVNRAAPVMLPAPGVRVASITLGDTALVLMNPSGAGGAEPPAFAAGLGARLATFGEGPCGLAVRSPHIHGRPLLDMAKTHQVPMEMGSGMLPTGSGLARAV